MFDFLVACLISVVELLFVIEEDRTSIVFLLFSVMLLVMLSSVFRDFFLDRKLLIPLEIIVPIIFRLRRGFIVESFSKQEARVVLYLIVFDIICITASFVLGTEANQYLIKIVDGLQLRRLQLESNTVVNITRKHIVH